MVLQKRFYRQGWQDGQILEDKNMQRFFARILVYIYRRFGIASSFYYVNAGEALPPPLSKEEEEECIRALGAGDESVKQTLIERNLRLVVYIARKFEKMCIRDRCGCEGSAELFL